MAKQQTKNADKKRFDLWLMIANYQWANLVAERKRISLAKYINDLITRERTRNAQ